jgi:DNA-binding transcriptional ArsR family regulator
MVKVRMAEVSSRLGNFTIIKMGQTVLISPCDTRMKILQALSKGGLTSHELAQGIDVSYSCAMDHLDFLERIGLVKATLVRREAKRIRNGKGRRRITFHLNENPLEGIEQLFMTAPRNGRGRSAAIVGAQPPIQT